MNVFHKAISLISKKVTPVSKTNQNEGDSGRIYILSAGLDPSQNTINRRLHKLNVVNKYCQITLHGLTIDQAERPVNICKQLMTIPRDACF